MRILILLLALPFASGLELTEVMFNPLGSDNGGEYIELIGPGSLEGCTVADADSSDVLHLIHNGSEVILIVEEDYLHETNNATLYSAGKAIGNALGNTADQIIVSCNATLINLSYSVAEIPGYKEGHSILYNGSWSLGPMNGSPGIIPQPLEPVPDEEAPEEDHTGDSGIRGCNTTLSLWLSHTSGHIGDEVTFDIRSGGFVSFVVTADNEPFLEGDTLHLRNYSFTLPNATQVKITALGKICDARQRAVRYIDINPPQINFTVPKIPTNKTIRVNKTVPVNRTEKAVIPAVRPELPKNETKVAVVYDETTNIIPWVSGFGIVTLLVSTGLFYHMNKEQKVYKDQSSQHSHERERD